MKKILLIINPRAGTMQASKNLAEIIEVFCDAGYETIVATTSAAGDATKIALERAGDVDVVVAAGGDGTFNEVAAGLIQAGFKTPMGYIPAGTTNDFASSLGLSSDVIQAAKDITKSKLRTIDSGNFNGRHFSYVASFGMFTSTSYDVPQNMKNTLGHLAYVLMSVKEMVTLNSQIFELKMRNGDDVYDGKYIFGAVCNSISMGGVLTLNESDVDLNDGKLEVLLVKAPNNMVELTRILNALLAQKYMDSPYITFFSCNSVEIEASPDMNWSLDGEFQEGAEHISIKNVYSAIDVLVPDDDAKFI